MTIKELEKQKEMLGELKQRHAEIMKITDAKFLKEK